MFTAAYCRPGLGYAVYLAGNVPLCAKRFAALIRRAQSEGARVVCLTPQPLYGVAYHDFGSGEVRCYNIDASTMKTMLRANDGMVLLEEGVIRAKKNCRDIRP